MPTRARGYAAGNDCSRPAAERYLRAQVVSSDRRDSSALRRFLMRRRQNPSRFYVIGSTERSHFMNVRIDPDGTRIGVDNQTGENFRGIEAIPRRMGSTNSSVGVLSPPQVAAQCPPVRP